MAQSASSLHSERESRLSGCKLKPQTYFSVPFLTPSLPPPLFVICITERKPGFVTHHFSWGSRHLKMKGAGKFPHPPAVRLLNQEEMASCTLLANAVYSES